MRKLLITWWVLFVIGNMVIVYQMCGLTSAIYERSKQNKKSQFHYIVRYLSEQSNNH